MNEAVRPCPRCEAGFEFTPELIAKRLAEIPIALSLVSEETVYVRRLEVCGKCEALKEQVLCAHCGCFVMFRARSAKSYCPHPEGDKWSVL